MKMVKGGIAADIIVSYINNSPLSFYLSADNLISLQRDDSPAPVLTAMLQRYGELQRQSGTAAGALARAPGPAPSPQYAGPPAQAPYQAAAPQYYSAPPPPVISYPYVAAPSYPVYDRYYFYDPYFYPGYPFRRALWSLALALAADAGAAGGIWGGQASLETAATQALKSREHRSPVSLIQRRASRLAMRSNYNIAVNASSVNSNG